MAAADVHVRVLGRLEVEVGSGAAPPGGRATRLLGLLSAYADEPVATADLVDVLWAGEDAPQEPGRIVAGLVSRLRGVVGRHRIEGGPRSYRLVTSESMTVDLTAARVLVDTAVAATEAQRWDDAFAAGVAAVEALTAGEPLADEPPRGVVRLLRHDVVTLVRRARETVWVAALHLGRSEVALDMALAVLDSEPLDEIAVRVGMLAHARLGQMPAALRLYDRLRTDLVDALGADPSVQTQALHLTLLRGEAAPELHGRAPAIPTAGLDPAVLDVLNMGAVLGRTFAVDVLAALADRSAEALVPMLRVAQEAGLLVAAGRRFAFSDDTTHAALHSGVTGPVVASRHRRAANLSGGNPVEEAQHWALAGEDRAAAVAWLHAADRLGDQPRVVEAVLGEALAAARRAGDPRLEAEALLRRSAARVDLERFAAARADAAEALEIARRLGDHRLEAAALEALGWGALHARDAYAAREFAERASELAESAADAAVAGAGARLLVGRIRHWDGDLDGAAEAYQQAMQPPPGPRLLAVALAYRGALLEHRDDYPEARRLLDRATRACAQSGQFRGLVQSLFFAAMARGNAGDLTGGLRLLDQARRLLDERGVEYYRAGIDVTASWLWRSIGDVGRARELAEGALDLVRQRGRVLEMEQELHALLALAECALAAGGQETEAAALAAEAATKVDHIPFVGRARLRVLDVRSRLEPELAEELLDAAQSGGSPKYTAVALHRLGRHEEAVATAERLAAALLLADLDPEGPAGRSAAVRIGRRLPADLRDTWRRQHAT